MNLENRLYKLKEKISSVLEFNDTKDDENLVQEAINHIFKCELTISRLKRGSCWCEVGIGNPMVSEHSYGCMDAQTILGASELRYGGDKWRE